MNLSPILEFADPADRPAVTTERYETLERAPD